MEFNGIVRAMNSSGTIVADKGKLEAAEKFYREILLPAIKADAENILWLLVSKMTETICLDIRNVESPSNVRVSIGYDCVTGMLIFGGGNPK